jgi:hypothetical protein
MRDDDPCFDDPTRFTFADWALAMVEERMRVPPEDELPMALRVMVAFRCGGIDCSAVLPEGKTLH